MDILDTQIRLYRKAQSILEKDVPDYSLQELKSLIIQDGKGLHFKDQTIEALLSRLDALEELKLITKDGINIQDIVKENQAIIFDLSMSSTYTSRIIVNFFADKLLHQRKKIVKALRNAQENNTKTYMEDYIPPCHLLIDEAHNIIPKNQILKKYIKEGRNCGCMLTAISQSPDLTRDIYANITHLFVGQLVFQDDIDKVKTMLPFEKTSKKFRKQVKSLDVGCFYYFNINEKIEHLIRVRARQTLHPASTILIDERKYLLVEDPELPGIRLKAEILRIEKDEFLASITEGN